MITNINQRQKNKGFTVLEVVIASALVALFLGVGVAAVTGYKQSAAAIERNQMARTAFYAVQDTMTKKTYGGGLDEYLASMTTIEVDMNAILTANGYDGTYISDYNANHTAGDIVGIVINEDNTANEPLRDDIAKALSAQGSVDKYTFLAEVNKKTGVVQAMFVSDLVENFNYDFINIVNNSNVLKRDSKSVQKKQQGYYGTTYTETTLNHKEEKDNQDCGMLVYDNTGTGLKISLNWREVENEGYLKWIKDGNTYFIRTGNALEGRRADLIEVNLPVKGNYVYDDVFQNCINMKKIRLPQNADTIGYNCFEGCVALEEIQIPDSVDTICRDAFWNCTSLTNIVIPDSVTIIGIDAFYNVPHITYHGTATGAPWGAKSMN